MFVLLLKCHKQILWLSLNILILNRKKIELIFFKQKALWEIASTNKNPIALMLKFFFFLYIVIKLMTFSNLISKIWSLRWMSLEVSLMPKKKRYYKDLISYKPCFIDFILCIHDWQLHLYCYFFQKIILECVHLKKRGRGM